ncbi:AQP [Symbiodinium sp. KB8]|nr:AQP [Symbiodinium sp. KB8]
MGAGGDTVDKESVFANYKSVFSRQFAVSLAVEFVGVMFFQILGGTSAKEYAPFVNGFALAVWIYVAANISGGHLNPAVSFSTAVCGFYPVIHTVIYIALQIIGAIVGAWVSAGLVPGAGDLIGTGASGPGCFDRGTIGEGITDEQVFGWECVMTFTLISCVYACGVAKPGHGSHTPFAVGLALLACAGSGGQYTGAALNPARVLGPMAVFQCGKDVVGLYIGGQFVAALLAMSVFAFVSGLGRENINDFAHAFSEFYASEGSEAPPRSKILDFERCFGVRLSGSGLVPSPQREGKHPDPWFWAVVDWPFYVWERNFTDPTLDEGVRCRFRPLKMWLLFDASSYWWLTDMIVVTMLTRSCIYLLSSAVRDRKRLLDDFDIPKIFGEDLYDLAPETARRAFGMMGGQCGWLASELRVGRPCGWSKSVADAMLLEALWAGTILFLSIGCSYGLSMNEAPVTWCFLPGEAMSVLAVLTACAVFSYATSCSPEGKAGVRNDSPMNECTGAESQSQTCKGAVVSLLTGCNAPLSSLPDRSFLHEDPTEAKIRPKPKSHKGAPVQHTSAKSDVCESLESVTAGDCWVLVEYPSTAKEESLSTQLGDRGLIQEGAAIKVEGGVDVSFADGCKVDEEDWVDVSLEDGWTHVNPDTEENGWMILGL